eukprot:COSAG02_NODE_28_length_51367_cov_70.053932_21_plen_266_part_00
MRLTSTDEVEVLIVRSQLLERAGLREVHPLGDLHLTLLLQVLREGKHEVVRRHILQRVDLLRDRHLHPQQDQGLQQAGGGGQAGGRATVRRAKSQSADDSSRSLWRMEDGVDWSDINRSCKAVPIEMRIDFGQKLAFLVDAIHLGDCGSLDDEPMDGRSGCKCQHDAASCRFTYNTGIGYRQYRSLEVSGKLRVCQCVINRVVNVHLTDISLYSGAQKMHGGTSLPIRFAFLYMQIVLEYSRYIPALETPRLSRSLTARRHPEQH